MRPGGAGRGAAWRRAAAGAALAAVAAACGSDTTAAGQGAVRFLLVRGADALGQQLVEYAAPPLAERRSMPTITADSTMYVLLRAGAGGGFYAMRFPGSTWRLDWQLVRYGDDWRVAASRTGTELLDTVTMATEPYLHLTPDGRYLVADVTTLPAYRRTVFVLDPATLAVVARLAPPLPVFYRAAPTAATGSEVMLAGPMGTTCPVPLEWLDVGTGLVADSTALPCDYLLNGALTTRRLYRYGPVSGAAHLELYDAASDAVVAASDSIKPGYQIYPVRSRGRLVFFEANDAAVADTGTLAVLGRVGTGSGGAGARTVMNSIVDPVTGDVVGAVADRISCVACQLVPNGVVVIDPAGPALVLDARLGVPVQVVP
jgi:hypothetical protein